MKTKKHWGITLKSNTANLAFKAQIPRITINILDLLRKAWERLSITDPVLTSARQNDQIEIRPKKIPTSWQEIEQSYYFNNQDNTLTAYVAHPSETPNGVIFLALGALTSPDKCIDAIRKLQSAGKIVVILPLIDKNPILPENAARFKSMVFNPKSVLFKLADDLPVTILTYSASSLIFEQYRNDETNLGKIPPNVDQVIELAPFMGMTSKTLEELLRTIEPEKLDRTIGSTRTEIFISAVANKTSEFKKRREEGTLLTYRQVAEILAAAKNLKPAKKSNTKLPITFIIGRNDLVANPTDAIKRANSAGSNHRILKNVGHNMINPETMDIVMELIAAQRNADLDREYKQFYNHDVSPAHWQLDH